MKSALIILTGFMVLIFPISIFGSNNNPFDGNTYWSDYYGRDEKSGPNQDQPGSDGIGDTPYEMRYYFWGDCIKIDQDRYPFMRENGWEAPVNQPPTLSTLNQYKSDAQTEISEDGITTESTVVFKAILNDPDNDQVKLQIELKEFNQPFDGTNFIESDFVPSGQQATVTRYGLVESKYKWRARAIDNRGATSDWQEFGETGNVDFEIKLVPLYTQIESDYPSKEETKRWSKFPYAYATPENPYPSCGWTIGDCGCAITSMVMLGRYYDIDIGVDNTNVDPGNINNWLASNNGYTSDGSLWWGKAIEYLGYIDEITGKKMVRFDFNPRTDYKVPFGSPKIDSFLDSAKPIIANSKTFGHYFVVDGKLTSTYTLKDPNWYNTQRLNQPQSLAQHIQGYNNYFDTTNFFTYLEQPKPLTASIHIYLASPAELLVTDPLDRKLGKNPITDMIYDEIPDGIYTIENPMVTSDVPLAPEQIRKSKVIYISFPIDGHYDIQVIGTDAGSYSLNTLLYDQNGESKAVIQEGNTIQNNIQQFELDYSSETIQQSDIYRIVSIDIKPGSYPNSINLKSKGLTPVAVLTNEFFDAKDIVIDSILFAGTSPEKGKLEDVDGDGDLDLILHFKTQSLQLTPTSTEAVLTGQLTGGTLIKGIDSVRIVQSVEKQTFFAKILSYINQFTKKLAALIGLAAISRN